MGKPQSTPRKPRCIRLTDEEYKLFKLAGGAVWLRWRLRNMGLAGAVKNVRNRNIRIDAMRGFSYETLAEKYKLDRVTIWRICK
jgi:hypothetical protein